MQKITQARQGTLGDLVLIFLLLHDKLPVRKSIPHCVGIFKYILFTAWLLTREENLGYFKINIKVLFMLRW